VAGRSTRLRIFNILNGKCFYCGCQLDFEDFHLDHFVAKSCNGGGFDDDNLVPSFPECNHCKSNLTLEEFREKLSSEIFNTFQGKMISKYYKIKPKRIKFYFEKEYEKWHFIER
jgi:CRISPR/Cas system Type II protein with McrA/HNH and RuvC-like nuclease domain